MSNPIDTMSAESLDAMLDYLSEEIQEAETKDDLMGVLNLMRELLMPTAMHSAVRGLEHIRAEVDHEAIARASRSSADCTVQLEIPAVLADTFQDLSARMRALQDEDPATFANATSALTWLASGDARTTN